MQIVIDIDEEIYNFLQRVDTGIPVDRAIANGIPLPKGHGRLIDADDLRKRFGHSINDMYAITEIDKTPTIIKATKK